MRISEDEILNPGHVACPGCGASLSMRLALKAIGRDTILVIPACCWSVIDGPFPYSAAGVPVFHMAFEAAAATASGIKAGLEAQGNTHTQVVAWAGDGGTFDIGLQALSGAAERNDDIIYVCYDNEAYQNTGIQRSSATPYLAWTTTTPVKFPKQEQKKDIVEIMAAHRIPYIATATVAFPEDLTAKFIKAKSIRGTKFIHILSPCPPGWKSKDQDSIKLSRLAVKSRIFPLIEIENGEKYKITLNPKPVAVKDYIRLQGRFRHISDEDIEQIQKNVDRNWEKLVKKMEGNL
jgi:pyruvate/2-oxoacid:ferredoxin oxidoreductase beta subunit